MTETRAHELLQAVYEAGELAPFDLATERWDNEADPLGVAKIAADTLVSLRLARYTDDGRTLLGPTNAGRYWALHGGYLAFLKEEPEKAAGKNRNPEADALRAAYMTLRLKTFWWSFSISVASFALSTISLMIALLFGDFLHRR